MTSDLDSSSSESDPASDIDTSSIACCNSPDGMTKLDNKEMCSDGATKDHESLDDLEQAQLAATLSASAPQQRKKQKKNQSRRKRLVDSLATKHQCKGHHKHHKHHKLVHDDLEDLVGPVMQCKPGSDEWYASLEWCGRDGPRDLSDMWLHQQRHLQQEVHDNPEGALRVAHLMQHGAECVTNWSGVEFPREAWRQWQIMLKSILPVKFRSAKPPLVAFTKSFDCDAVCRDVLKNYSDAQYEGDACIFGKIEDKIPEDKLQILIDFVGPYPEKMTKADKAKMASKHEDLMKLLLEHRRSLFPRDHKAYCHGHDKQCSVKSLATHCPKFGGYKLSPTRIKMSHGSPVCTGWCRGLGGGQGKAHHSMFAHNMHVAERTLEAEELLEDFSWLEQNGRYPIDTLYIAHLPHHHVVYVRICVKISGRPLKRFRTFGCAINKHTIAWLGSMDMNKIQREFEEFIHHRCLTSGEVYFSSPNIERAEEYKGMLKNRGVFWDHGQDNEIDFNMDLIYNTTSPGTGLRLLSHLESDKSEGPCLFDLDHWDHVFCGRHTRDFPHLLTHGCVLSRRQELIATSNEHLVAMGVPVYGVPGSQDEDWQTCPMAEAMRELNRKQRNHVVGNGIQVNLLTYWYYFVLSRCMRKPLIGPRAMPVPDTDSEDVEESDSNDSTKVAGLACEELF